MNCQTCGHPRDNHPYRHPFKPRFTLAERVTDEQIAEWRRVAASNYYPQYIGERLKQACDTVEHERARADANEKLAREANAECIKHWNRADAAEAKLAELGHPAQVFCTECGERTFGCICAEDVP